jgi:hypothetical protein
MTIHMWDRSVSVRFVLLVTFFGFMPSTGSADTHVSGYITTSTTWSVAGSPYIVDSTVIVREAAVLTIEPGVIIKLNGSTTSLRVEGTLSAIATAESRITFTSIQDDSIGGDNGGDGPTEGVPGQWGWLTIEGSAVLEHVDVRYGGTGSANHAYGAMTVIGTASIDYSRFYSNERSGLRIASGGSATVAHSEFFQNGNGISASGGPVQISANSKISGNSDTGLWLNYLSSYTGTPASIVNSEISSNAKYGVNLQVDSAIASSSAPFGHQNNIINNGSGNDQRQLFTMKLLTQSLWTDNFWGDGINVVLCSWAPGSTQQKHLTPEPFLGYCVAPGAGPTRYLVYLTPGGCPNNQSQKCASDWVTNYPFAANAFDNGSW